MRFLVVCFLYCVLINSIDGFLGTSSNKCCRKNVHSDRVLFTSVVPPESTVDSIMPPADLTPAVDKYERLPLGERQETYSMSAKGKGPDGPDPFKLVANELSPLSDFVKDLVVSENPVLTMAASHFFDQVSL